MIDLHSHVLFGLDDGARSVEESVAMVREAEAEGVSVLAATPHVRADYPTTAEQMEERLREVTAATETAGLAVRLVAGGELSLEEAARLPTAELQRLSLGGAGTLLVEFPYQGWPVGLDEQLFTLRARGFRVLLAHPERNAEVAARPDRLRPLVESGVLVQVTAASLTGTFGSLPQRAGQALLRLGLAHVIARDVHAAGEVRSGLGAVMRTIPDRALASRLTREAPAAILAGEELPPMPARRALARRAFGVRTFRRS